jgi:hypothetical protein
MAINVELFTSDSTLRDKRLRHDYLESNHYPVATFEPTAIIGLPDVVEDGTTHELIISGQLLLKETRAPVSFAGPVTIDAGRITASMTSTVLLSSFDVGPINLSGLVHTADEAELAFELVADRVGDRSEVAADVAAVSPVSLSPPGAGGSVSFGERVQPILEARCVSCHTIGGPGYSTISLDTAGEAAEIAQGIALVTRSGFMPPWPASDLGLAMEHDFSLTDDELATLLDWSADGGGLDVDPSTVLNPTAPPFPPIDADLELTPAEPYVGSLDKKDDYRCVVTEVPDPEGDGTWIRSMQFVPDKDEIVHHAIIAAVTADSRPAIDAYSAAEEGSGFTCYATIGGLPGVNGGNIGGWTPGSQPRSMPEGYAIYLEPGSFIVNQIHYHFDHENPPDLSTILLDTIPSAEVAALEAAGTPLKRTRGRSYMTPAEGPCTPDEEGPLCDRDTVLQEIGAKYGPLFSALPDGLISRCGGTLEDYAQLDGTVFRSVCDVSVRQFGRIYQLGPHMHEFGAAYRMTLNPETAEERILVDIPTWSFEWQLNYNPVEDVFLEPGDVLRIECQWDRALVAMPEPRYITWSDGTVDEMCFSTVVVLPDP